MTILVVGFIQDADMEVDPARSEATFRWTVEKATELYQTTWVYSPELYVGNMIWKIVIGDLKNNFKLYVMRCDNSAGDGDSWMCKILKGNFQILPASTRAQPLCIHLPVGVVNSKQKCLRRPFATDNVDFVLRNFKNDYIKDDTIVLEAHLVVENPNSTLYAVVKQNEKTLEAPALIQAIREEDSEKCLNLISNESVNTKDQSERTPLMWAAYKGNVVILKMLIEANVDIDVADCYGYTSLMRAVERGHKSIVELLLDTGADVNVWFKDCLKCKGKNFTALHFAGHSLDNRMEIAKLLLEKGADIASTSIENAIKLIENKANLDSATIALSIIAQKNLKLMEMLLQRVPVEINDVNVEGSSLLLHAIREGCLEIVKFLVENGANPCKRGKKGDAPLLVAVLKNNVEIVNFLLENGGRFMVHSALYIALLNQNREMVSLMLDNDANANLVAKDGYTPLTKSIELDNFQLVELLIENKADVNLVDKNTRFPIALAVEEGNLEIIQHLLKSGANPNVLDKNGSTPLMKLIEKGRKNIVQLLLKNHADVNLSDCNGTTPLMAALNKENLLLFKCLIENGANLDFSLEVREKIVSKAVETDNWMALIYLIEAGVDLSALQHLLLGLSEENLDFAMFLNKCEGMKGLGTSSNCGGDHEEASSEK